MNRILGILTKSSSRSLRTLPLLVVLTVGVLSLAGAVLTRGFFHAAAASHTSFARYMPNGALLYIEAKDLGQLLTDWNQSPEKQVWADSDNYSVFSKSRLFLRLQSAQTGFAAAAGVPPDLRSEEH